MKTGLIGWAPAQTQSLVLHSDNGNASSEQRPFTAGVLVDSGLAAGGS
jgi:hypothetical protein